jgi:hypothetical protein
LIRKEDADAIRKIRNDIIATGTTGRAANEQAVVEFIGLLQDERAGIMKEVENRGGVFADQTLSVSKFATQPTKKKKASKPVPKERPFRFKAEDHDVNEFEEKLVEAEPAHPISSLNKIAVTLDTAEKAALPNAKGWRAWVDKLANAADSSKEVILAAVPQTKLPDFIRSGTESAVKQYVKLMHDMTAYMETVMESHAELGDVWLEFNRKYKKGAKLLGEFMHASTLAGVDVPTFEKPTKEEYTKMSKARRAMWDKRAEDYEILLPFWKKLGTIGEKVQYERLLWNAETDKNEVISTAEVSESQAIYLRVRDTYENMRRRGMQGLEDRIAAASSEAGEDENKTSRTAQIAELRKLFESGKINPYFPLSRFGQHGAVAKNKDGEVVGFFKRETRQERDRLVEELRKEGFTAYKVEDTDNAGMAQQIDPDFVAQVTRLIGTEVEESLGIQDEIWQMYLRSLPEMSVRKAFIHREGRLGFSHDALRAFGDHTFHGTHQLGKLKYGYQLQEQLLNADQDAAELTKRVDDIENMEQGRNNPEGISNDLTMHEVMMLSLAYKTEYLSKADKKIIADGGVDEKVADEVRAKLKAEAAHDGPWAAPLVRELKKRHDYNMNPKSASWATNFTAFGFLWFLSSSPAAGLLNLTQTAISAYPILRAEFAGRNAGIELLKASKEYASSSEIHSGDFGNKLRNDEVEGVDPKKVTHGEKAAFEYFKEIGMFAKTRTRDLMGLAERGTQQKDGMASLMNAAGYIFHKTEEANRMVTALAAYRLARKKLQGTPGMSAQAIHEKAALQAEELVEMSHYDYTNTNRPRFMQGDLARVAFLFRNYSVNMQYRLARDFRDGIWKNNDISLEERKKARSRFMGILGMTSMFAGVSGLPLYWAVAAIANMLFDDPDEPYDFADDTRIWLADMTSPETAEFIMKGAWDSVTGTTLSGRTSLNNLWIREAPESKRGKDLLLHLAGEAAGPIFGVGMNFFQGFSDFAKDQPQRGIERFMPKAAADVMKTIRYSTQGAQSYRGDLIVSPEEFTKPEIFAQAMGLAPARLTLQYEQNRIIKDRERRLVDRRKQLTDRYFVAVRLGDRRSMVHAIRGISAWNEKQPRWPITPATIKRSAKTRANTDMRTMGGVSVQKSLQYLTEERRITRKK